MILPICCAGALLAEDLVLRACARLGKLNGTLLGGQVRLEMLENRGMAGGALKNRPRLARMLSCGGLLAAMILCRGELLHGQGASCWGAALLCAGGAGNVLERLVWGRVTDYIRFPRLPGMRLGRLVWNLADFMLLAGALLLAAGGLQ